MLPDFCMELLGCLGTALGASFQEFVLEYGTISVNSDEYEWIRLLCGE